MDRNFCAPNNKNAALFVDLDGTTVVCQPYFDEARASFLYFMKLRGLDAQTAVGLVAEIEKANAETEGFEREMLGKAYVDCYLEMVKNKKRRFTEAVRLEDTRILRNIATGPFFRTPQLFPNAAAVLGRAHHNFLMFAISIGNREAQKYKVRQAGLDPVFDEPVVTARDDKAEIVKQFIEDWNIDPKLSAVIGNSRRSDGACLAVTNFIYLPMEGGWAFDHSKELPADTGYEMFSVKDWREAEEKAINRLVRRRKSLRNDGPASKCKTC
jgi:FMN phosphatase YigB (HAD superfamily)